MPGVLSGIRILEFAGIGPAPFCGMMLADHGAEVIRISRLGAQDDLRDPLLRSRRSIALDLKHPNAKDVIFDLLKTSHGLIEGFRPGVMERLSLGPDEVLSAKSDFVYGRMTGWGQHGPYAHTAGHDINYIALSGALHMVGREGQKPNPPANLIGDFGGGGMMLAFGMVSALLAVKNGQAGQVVDCAMTDGSATLSAAIWGLLARGLWKDEAGVNVLDGGAHFYDTYETKDGKWISIGSIEPQFYALLREKLGLFDDRAFDAQRDPSAWPALRGKLTNIFLTKTRDEWCEILEMTDVCFSPVLSMCEAPDHPHNVARNTFISVNGITQPRPAPVFSKEAYEPPVPPCEVGIHTQDVLAEIGYSDDVIEKLKEDGVSN